MFVNIGPYHDDEGERLVVCDIHAYDTWNMDSTLAIIILPMLKQFRKQLQGAPGTLLPFSQTSNTEQICFDFYVEGDEAAWEEGHRQWEDIVDQMIWSFEQLQPGVHWEDQYYSGDLDTYFEKEENSHFSIMKKGPKHTFKADMKGLRAHQERINKGLEYFGRYYQSLWE
jgi:hypothetical protein